MAIYTKKNSEKIDIGTIRLDPGCYLGDKIYKFIASLEKPRFFYVSELIADGGPEEIASILRGITHPEQRIRPLWQLERDAIHEALTLLDDDKQAAAKALGISAATLEQKLKEYEGTPEKSSP